MNVPLLNDSVRRDDALAALREYKQHRAAYDDRDWEIERIYRQISKGKTVISVNAAIATGGVTELGQPKLAIARADAQRVRYTVTRPEAIVSFSAWDSSKWEIRVECPKVSHARWDISDAALVPRIPPQHRPEAKRLKGELSL